MQRDPTPGSWVRAARQLGWTAPSLQQAMHFHHVAFLALPFYANPPPHPLIFKCESAAPLPKSALCWGTSVPHTPLKASARGKPGRDGYTHSCCPPWGPTGLPPSQPAKETHSHHGHKLTHFGPCTVLHFPPLFASLPEAQIHIHGTGEIRGSRKTAAGTNPCTGFPKSQGNAVGASCTTSNNSEHLLQE